MQALNAYALAFAQAVSCRCLLLGRWTLDSQVLELLAPSRSGVPQLLDQHVFLVEPLVGPSVTPPIQIHDRGMRFVRLPGVIRVYPLLSNES